MDDSNGYAVFFFPQALEALGDTIKPYLQAADADAHVLCNGIDTAGAFVEMTLTGKAADGREQSLELMVPSGMVRMVVSTHSDGRFGFGPQVVETRSVAAGPAAATPAAATGDIASAVGTPA